VRPFLILKSSSQESVATDYLTIDVGAVDTARQCLPVRGTNPFLVVKLLIFGGADIENFLTLVFDVVSFQVPS
jgi:hypothetical protein